MRKPGRLSRGLSEAEATAWAQLAASVVPIHSLKARPVRRKAPATEANRREPKPAHPVTPRPPYQPAPAPPAPRGKKNAGLDSHWERRLRAGTLSPDVTLDLHEHSLDAAYNRLLGGLDIARETGARVVLVIAGRERPAPAADRSGQRGAIRAKLLDWLSASRHSTAIAGIRKAHRRHGGEGGLYVILKKPR